MCKAVLGIPSQTAAGSIYLFKIAAELDFFKPRLVNIWTQSSKNCYSDLAQAYIVRLLHPHVNTLRAILVNFCSKRVFFYWF